MEQENRIDIYTIPPNFAEEGTLLSGRIKTRNGMETGALLLVLVPILLSLNTSARIKMYVAMIVLVPVVILSVIGVQGESLFGFIGSFFRYVRRRRYLAPPDERYRMEQNRRKKRLRKGETGKEKFKKGKREKTRFGEGERQSQAGKDSQGKQETEGAEKRNGYGDKNTWNRKGTGEMGEWDSQGDKKGCGKREGGESGKRGGYENGNGQRKPGRMEPEGNGPGKGRV